MVKVYTYRRIRERNRWLRSDGKPNFKDRIHRKPSELSPVILEDAPTIGLRTPILRVCEVMSSSGIRMTPVIGPNLIIEGVLTGMDIIDYLGGGPRYNIILSHSLKSIYDALKMPAENIMRNNPVVVSEDANIPEVLEVMIKYGVGALPVINRDGRYVGLITERSLVKYLTGKVTGVKVAQVMSTELITADDSSSIGDAMKLMINTGVRRLPVVGGGGEIKGILAWKDIIDMIGRHRVFNLLKGGDIKEFLNIPISMAMRKEVLTIDPESDIGIAASIMNVKNVGSLLVVSKGEVKGIVTERDVLYGTVAV